MNQKTILRSVLAAVLSLVATAATAHDFEVDGIFYKYNGDGTVSVTYKGSTFHSDINRYTGDVVIPSSVAYSGTVYSVSSIGGWAFKDCSGLTSVTIPNSVTSIGGGAFDGCSGLTSVTIGNSVTSIGDQAFYCCSGLTSVTIPNSVTSIGELAFIGCSGLTSVISKAVTPPACSDGVFSTETYSVPLIVPSVAKEAYQAAWTWSNFSIYAEPDNKITAIAINNNVANLVTNYTLQLSATVTPEDATFADVLQWTSSNPEVATVDDNGLVTAIAKGDAEIKVMTCDYSNLSASYTIKVAVGFEVGGIYYNRTGDGTVSVTFKGNSYNEYANEYTGDVVIPSSVTYSGTTYSVTSIGNYAFYDCSRGLKSVTIPNSVTSIGDNAFNGCSGLTSVTIPNSVTKIGSYAFYRCSDLTSVTIPNSVTSISDYAFFQCWNLRSLTIPNSVTSIGNYAFYDCSRGLKSVTIPNSVTSIGSYAFCACSILTSVTIPNSVTSIGAWAFNGCRGLTSVSIGNSVTKIGSYAFQSCSGLTSVSIPNSVTSIGNYAFNGCSGLTSVTIGKSVTSIDSYAFDGCSGLTSVISKAVTPPTCGSRAFSTATYSGRLIVPSVAKQAYKNTFTWRDFRNYAEPDNKITAIAINNNEANLVIDNTLQLSATVTPEDATFADVLQWTSSNPEVATVDDNGLVTAIAKGDAEIKVMTCDYSNLSASYTIKVAEVTANNFEVGGIYYNRTGDGTVSVTFKGSSYDEYANEYTGDVEIPSSVTYSGTTYSVTSIGSYAFYRCSDLTSVTIPNSVTSIGDWAFYRCSGLKSVTIGNSVTSIGKYAFSDCSGLTSITIPNSVTSIGSDAFRNCAGLTSIIVDSENQIYDSRENCNAIIETASNKLLYGSNNTIIPNSVTSIGDQAFSSRSGLTSVTIPNSVTSIGDYAFRGCRGLTRVSIGNSVTSIGKYVFFQCSGLTSVISKAVTPPTCTSSTFSTYSVPLIVPSVAKEAYQAAPYWSNFSNYAEPERKITAMEFGASTFGIENGKTLQLTAKVTPEDATFADILQWTSSNPKIATVDNEGLVTTHALGSTVITARSCDYSNISATCTVVVCPKAANVNDLVEGDNIVGFGLQGVKMHNGVLYACTTTESVNKSTPDFHGNDANNMASYEDRNFADFDQRDWVAISGLEEGFEGKELSYPFEANFADG
ncbi:MAG: leucine-rich repeat protein, partial [Bacteroidales bacterium]|nr:leucine-rich repeat protein [Bacteroidales bacterium]